MNKDTDSDKFRDQIKDLIEDPKEKEARKEIEDMYREEENLRIDILKTLLRTKRQIFECFDKYNFDLTKFEIHINLYVSIDDTSITVKEIVEEEEDP